MLCSILSPYIGCAISPLAVLTRKQISCESSTLHISKRVWPCTPSIHSFSCMHHISILQLLKEARMEVLEPDLKNHFQQTVLATASALQSYDSVPTNNTSTQDSSSQNPCDKFGEVLLKSMQGLPLPQVTLLTPKCMSVLVTGGNN